MKKRGISTLGAFTLILTLGLTLSGCGKGAKTTVKELPPLDASVPAEKCAVLVIPAGATVTHIDGAARHRYAGLLRLLLVQFPGTTWSPTGLLSGATAATLLVPAGEHTITWEYSTVIYAGEYGQSGWSAGDLEYSADMSAGKMYMLSVTRDEKARNSLAAFIISGPEFVNKVIDSSIPIIPSLAGFLPRANPLGVIYGINEIDQTAFDQFLGNYNDEWKSELKKERSHGLMSILSGFIWFGLILGVYFLSGILLWMGNFMQTHGTAVRILGWVFLIGGYLALNLNSSGSLPQALASALLLGIGLAALLDRETYKEGKKAMEEQNYTKAKEWFTYAIDAHPKKALYYNERGCTYTYLQDWRRALDDCNEAVRLHQKQIIKMPLWWTQQHLLFLRNRGAVYIALEEWKPAIDNYSEAIKLDPKNAEYFGKRADAYLALQDRQHAIDDYTAAINLDPKNSEYYLNRGGVYAGLQDYQNAIDDCSAAIKLIPEEPKDQKALMLASRGFCYCRLQNWKQAIDDFTEAVRLRSDSEALKHMLAVAQEVEQNPALWTEEVLQIMAALLKTEMTPQPAAQPIVNQPVKHIDYRAAEKAAHAKKVSIILLCLAANIAFLFAVFSYGDGAFVKFLFDPNISAGGAFLLPALIAAIIGFVVSLLICSIADGFKKGAAIGALSGLIGSIILIKIAFSSSASQIGSGMTIIIIVIFALIGVIAGAVSGLLGGLVGFLLSKVIPLSDEKSGKVRIIAVPVVCLAILGFTAFNFAPVVVSGISGIKQGIDAESAKTADKASAPVLTSELIAELCDRSGPVIKGGKTVNVQAKGAAARIYRVAYAKDWTVISILRTNGSHREIKLTEPGGPGAYYIEDLESDKKFPIRGIRHFDDTESGAGADLIFDAIGTRHFNMIEGDTGAEGWHFYEVKVPE